MFVISYLCVFVALISLLSGRALNSTFKNRQTPEYKNGLGQTIVNFCRLIPDGVLVFFPSYSAMNECIAHWKLHKGTWSSINKLKPIFVEPNSSADLGAVIAEYNENIVAKTGAILLAVCRGKVSEGIDFSDARCRGSFCVSMPQSLV